LEKALSLQNVGEAFFQKEHILRGVRGAFLEKALSLQNGREAFFEKGIFRKKSRGEKCSAPTLLVNVSGPFLYHDGHVHPDTFPF